MKHNRLSHSARAAVLLLTAFLFLSLSGCSAKGAASVTDGNRRIELVGGFYTPKIVRVADADSGEVIWSEDVRIERSAKKSGDNWGLRCVDLNFDGRNDILVASSVSGDLTREICFLQQDDGSYLRNNDLSGLSNLHADGPSHSVLSFTRNSEPVKSALNGKYYRVDTDSVVQMFVDGNQVTPWKSVSIIHYAENDRYCYSISYWDEETRSFTSPDDRWLTAQEYAARDWSFFYYFKS